MDLVKQSVAEFIGNVDSDSPAPGGGSVSSLVSTIGCALARMVGHLSFGKKKFEALDETEKQLFQTAFDELKKIQDRLEILIDEDTKSFGVFMDAMKLPKETDEEKQYRKAQMEEATKVIIKVPYEIAQISLDALKVLNPIIEYGNKNAITDVGVGSILLCSGIEGAILNVKINLPGLSCEDTVNDYIEKCNAIQTEAVALKTAHLKAVNSFL